jgi:hypothetical protein
MRHALRAGTAGRWHAVGSSAFLIILAVLAVGVFVGWHLRHATGANSDLKAHKTRIPNFRKSRNRSGLMIAALVVFALLILRALVR